MADGIAIMGGGCHSCDIHGCDAVPCGHRGGGRHCPRRRGAEAFMDAKDPSCIHPHAFGDGDRFTFGVEIELGPSDDFVENVTDPDLIAGWNKDASPERNGVEPQSDIPDVSGSPALRRIAGGIPEYGPDAGGHIHVAEPIRGPLASGATRTGRGTVPSARHAPHRRRPLAPAHPRRACRRTHGRQRRTRGRHRTAHVRLSA